MQEADLCELSGSDDLDPVDGLLRDLVDNRRKGRRRWCTSASIAARVGRVRERGHAEPDGVVLVLLFHCVALHRELLPSSRSFCQEKRKMPAKGYLWRMSAGLLFGREVLARCNFRPPCRERWAVALAACSKQVRTEKEIHRVRTDHPPVPSPCMVSWWLWNADSDARCPTDIIVIPALSQLQ